MRKPVFVFATVIFMLPGLAAQGQKQAVLWAGISVPQPIFSEGGTARLTISFGVHNDGASAVNPKIGASHLYISGIEPGDWPFVINNGLRTPEFEALPPGHFLSFGYMLGDRYFAKPGIYTLRWEGDSFRSPELTFRVVPASH
jgi:hypothetical protein